MSTKPKVEVRRTFYRIGILAMEQRLLRDKLHGPQRTWYRNGQMSEEIEYRHGLRHGVSRQWDENGKLLGSCHAENGTGIFRSWYDNGQLNMEFGTVEGRFCGRNCSWLRDGTLSSDEVLLFNRVVTPGQYRKAAAKDARLPKLHGRVGKPMFRSRKLDRRNHRLFVSWLLAKPHCSEVRVWLNAGGKNKRTLGLFKRPGAAIKFVEELYQAGAVKVVAPDIYHNRRGDQFADCLLVQLPKAARQRTAIRTVCSQLEKGDLGAFLPEKDEAESHLYVSMG
jgi:hypothetical protein